MAKETAHQLGTPISAMLGWIDHVKMMHETDEELMEVMQELRKDVGRLELIADRFSKIGSAPELKPVNIYKELEKMRAYMQRRAPRKVTFDFPDVHASRSLNGKNERAIIRLGYRKFDAQCFGCYGWER